MSPIRAEARAALVALVALVGHTSPAEAADRADRATPADERAPQHPTFVGRGECATCHPEQMARWRGSDHDLAMQPADPDTVLGRFDGSTFREAGGASPSTFRERDGRFFVETEDASGEPREFEIAYTFGARPLQQYLIAFPGGRYQPLNLAWDSRPAASGGQRWFALASRAVAPPGDPFHWTGRRQTWNAMCAECHSTGLRKGYDYESDSYRTTWSEIDVSCEACHGPASRHLSQASKADSAAGAGAEAGFDAERGFVTRRTSARAARASWLRAQGQRIAVRSPPRTEHGEIESCARCHALRTPLREQHDHGLAFADGYRLALLDRRYHVDGQIRDEVYVYGSFLQSRMYAAGVTCSDCHDPHSLKPRAQGNALCGRCHDPQAYDAPAHHFHGPASAGSACVACHMPATTYMGVDARRDHRLGVPRPDLNAALGVPDPCTACHPDRPPEWAAAQIASRHGDPKRATWAGAFRAARTGAPDAASRLLAVAGDPAVPGFVAASALQGLEAFRPEPAWLAAIDRALGSDDAQVRRAGAALLQSLPAQVRPRAGDAALRDPLLSVRNEAALALARAPRAGPAAADPALERALREYERTQRANADLPEGAMNLAAIREATGRPKAARRALEHALKLDPSFAPGAVNLADLHRSGGRDDRGERVLRSALLHSPDSADLHHALGLTLVRAKRTAEALAALERAAELAPEVARYAWVYAVALHDSGDRAAALRVLATAVERHPADPDLSATRDLYRRGVPTGPGSR